MKKHVKKRSMREYSKKIIAAMILLWFIVAIFGISLTTYQAITVPEYINAEGLYNFVGYPMTGGIIGYLIKSAVENKQKIKNASDSSLSDDSEEGMIPNG